MSAEPQLLATPEAFARYFRLMCGDGKYRWPTGRWRRGWTVLRGGGPYTHVIDGVDKTPERTAWFARPLWRCILDAWHGRVPE